MKEKETKERALALLRSRLAGSIPGLAAVDPRLAAYVGGVAANEPDRHNLYEVLACLKFLRVFAAYPFAAERVRHAFRLYEGRWTPDGGRYVPGSGGLLFSGRHGRQHYRLTPVQTFMLAGVFGPHAWVCTGDAAGSRPVADTEAERPDGMIWDLRRLVTEADYFIPRKFGKTTLGAFFQFYGFFFGDYNYEGYCCANSADQAKILYRAAYDLIRQLDPEEHRIRFTATEINWKPGQPRAARIVALSAGGKTKDGLFAQFCSSDEYGSAAYVKGHSDMGALVNVVEGSMGPRREPLTIHTTTAGNVASGPYQTRLEGIKRQLEGEVEKIETIDSIETIETIAPGDRTFALLLQPDAWETDEEYLFTHPDVWHKVNPHIGITIQPDFYRREIDASRRDPEKRRETVTKLFNVWQSDRVKEWITAGQIRRLQTTVRIDDLSSDDGWRVFCGMDFSLGGDLHAQTYLCANTATGEFFADMDAWITEETLHSSTIRPLYELWVREGWLHVSPGATLQPDLPIGRIIRLSDRLAFMRFGYDPYKARQPVNTLSAWIYSLGHDPKDYVVPVRQNFATYNPAVLELDYMIRNDPPMIRFSPNPMWPWQFQNCLLAESADGMENHKPVKARPGSDGCKVDNVQCLCSALILYDQMDGTEHDK